MGTTTEEPQSLFCLCARKLCFATPPDAIELLQPRIPLRLYKLLAALEADVLDFRSSLPPEADAKLPERCYLLDPATKALDPVASVLTTERFLGKVDYFDLCARYALDEPTALTYEQMTQEEQGQLLERNAVVWCRALELSPRRAILHYDEVALFCAANGFLRAMERSLLNVRSDDGSLLPKCVMSAIESGHYAIANHFECDNYHEAFYCSFPDGNVPAQLFATLLNSQKIRQGVQIAAEILEWLPELSIQRLRRMIERDERIPSSTLTRFDSMYGEMTDRRDYPNDND